MEITFDEVANEDLAFWRKSGNKQVQKKISELLQNIQETPFEGIGKPEGLKHQHTGKWSRRITNEHRLVYKVTESQIQILSMRGHYLK